MTKKGAIYALGVVVLMGTMAVAAFADDQDMNAYGSANSSVSSQSEQGMEQQSTGEIREPMETGALPEGSVRSKVDNEGWVNMDVSAQNESPDTPGPPQHPERRVAWRSRT